jgi:hypothetical protein
MLLDGESEEELDPQFMKKVLHKILIYIQREIENIKGRGKFMLCTSFIDK